jgi:hypothetical protein
MRNWTEQLKRLATPRWLALALVVLFAPYLLAQETTGGLQGTVKDPSGAVVPGATVTVTTPTLVGSKVVVTDAAGYYRFANLPPGSYTILVKAAGFQSLKRENVILEVGHLPTVDLGIKVGTVDTVVEVKTEGPMIDTTTNTTLTNIPEDVLQDVPHGTSFQSVIQFAPAARNEPLEGGMNFGNGSGSTSPGNGGNGGAFGFSIGGGADSENSYLVEGQETANIIGGYSHTNVPMDFIQEVQMKTSGVDAEYGGALGGVVNVIMNKGTNHWHGSAFTGFQDGAMNGSPLPTLRYNPVSSGTPTSWGAIDPAPQVYQPIRPHTSDFWPGITIGGPIADVFPKFYGVPDGVYNRLKERLSVYAAFNPEFNAYEQTLNYGPANGGKVPISQNTHTFYNYARLDAEVTQKIRVFGSWLDQGQRQAGETFPQADSVQGYVNAVTGCEGLGAAFTCPYAPIPMSVYSHSLGYTAPNITVNTGADITLTNALVATTRFGYYFENYHDFGYGTTGAIYDWFADGTSAVDTNGIPISTSAPALANPTGFVNQALDQNFTHVNANKAIQFDADLAWFHAGKGGTHNLKFGYQLNRNSNFIFQGYNAPLVEIDPGTSTPYAFQGFTGQTNCQTPGLTDNYSAAAITLTDPTGLVSCEGTYGTVNVNDFGSGGKATSYNHGFFVQDAWTVGKGITINAGLRLEHEYLPAENQPATEKITTPINFSWADKIAPRIGGAWDVLKNGKVKIFGGYGEYYDQMKLNVAISSYGGQYWQECWYALMEPSVANILPELNTSNRYCVGPDATSQANFGGTTPAGLIFLENQNLRAFPTTCSTCSTTQEGTAPGLKPYAQHDSTFGVDYQLGTNLAFEARWDRRRLDHVIEDSAIYNPAVGETFVIVNPGQGVNATFNGFYNFLYGVAPDCSAGCPPQKVIPAARSYDGVELRLTKAVSRNWMGMFSYTYSNLRGNYTGLTSSEVGDGGGGRNAPNNSRAFDEPFFSWDSHGASSSGLLPTDRPNAFKGYVYYTLPWLKKMATDFGVFQSAYSGSPLSSYLDVGYAFPGGFPTWVEGQGKWVDVTQSAASGLITVSAPYVKRMPWFTDTDFNVKQSVKLGEAKTLAFDATFSNILNQHAVVSEGQQIDSGYSTSFIAPNGQYIVDGPAFYAQSEGKYNYVAEMNAAISNGGGPLTVNSQYGKPSLYQVARNVRLGLHLTF